MAWGAELSTDLALIPVGKFLGEHPMPITPEAVRRFSAGAEDWNAWYTGPSPWGGPVAPALIGSHEPWRFPGWYPNEVRGNLHIKQEWDLFHAIAVGSACLSRAFVAERYIRRDRHVIVNEVAITDRTGRPLARGRTHMAFLRRQGDGLVVERERERSPDRQFRPGQEEAMETIEGESHVLTPELCRAAADGKDNYHSNPAIAREWGFPGVVVQGVFNANIVSSLMTRRFGTGWFDGGRMRMSFVNITWGGDRVRARVRVLRLVDEEPKQRAECEAWVEKADGTVTAIGTVSAVV